MTHDPSAINISYLCNETGWNEEKITIHNLLFAFSVQRSVCKRAMFYLYQNGFAIGWGAGFGTQFCYFIFGSCPIYDHGVYWLAVVEEWETVEWELICAQRHGDTVWVADYFYSLTLFIKQKAEATIVAHQKLRLCAIACLIFTECIS